MPERAINMIRGLHRCAPFAGAIEKIGRVKTHEKFCGKYIWGIYLGGVYLGNLFRGVYSGESI